MDAEVEEMTRDRRNNILIHGLPVQVGQHNTKTGEILVMIFTRTGR